MSPGRSRGSRFITVLAALAVATACSSATIAGHGAAATQPPSAAVAPTNVENVENPAASATSAPTTPTRTLEGITLDAQAEAQKLSSERYHESEYCQPPEYPGVDPQAVARAYLPVFIAASMLSPDSIAKGECDASIKAALSGDSNSKNPYLALWIELARHANQSCGDIELAKTPIPTTFDPKDATPKWHAVPSGGAQPSGKFLLMYLTADHKLFPEVAQLESSDVSCSLYFSLMNNMAFSSQSLATLVVTEHILHTSTYSAGGSMAYVNTCTLTLTGINLQQGKSFYERTVQGDPAPDHIQATPGEVINLDCPDDPPAPSSPALALLQTLLA